MQRQRNPEKPAPLHTQRDTPIKTTLLYIKSGFLFVYVEKKADKVSANITAMLAEKAFNFSTAYFCKIHERLFKGVFDKVPAGKFRNYNITKREWVLDGDTVYYSDWELIPQTLDYDFNAERDFDYSTLSKDDVVRHITRFIANIWQVHAFGEGNTRTTAVFAIKYLRALGFDAANKPFEENSWYFRNALVRANYTNVQKGVYMNAEYLEKFFRNLMLGEENEIKNRLCHIRYGDGSQKVTAKVTAKVTQKVTAKLSNNQNKILEEIRKNPFITQSELSELVGITRKAIIQNMKKLQDAGLIERVGSDKSGKWAMGGDTFISPSSCYRFCVRLRILLCKTRRMVQKVRPAFYNVNKYIQNSR